MSNGQMTGGYQIWQKRTAFANWSVLDVGDAVSSSG